VERESDGREVETSPDGTYTERDEDGPTVVVRGDGSIAYAYKPGSALEDKKEESDLPQTAEELILDGIALIAEPSTSVRRHTGERYETWPGITRLTFPDGPVHCLITFAKDGSQVQLHSDGLAQATLNDGCNIQRLPNGTVVEEHVDGRRIEIAADGTYSEEVTGGTRVSVSHDGISTLRTKEGIVVRNAVNTNRKDLEAVVTPLQALAHAAAASNAHSNREEQLQVAAASPACTRKAPEESTPDSKLFPCTDMCKPRYEMSLDPGTKKIIVVLHLPLVQATEDINLEVSEQSLRCGVSGCYDPISLRLPMRVDQSSICAEFDQDKKALTLKMVMATHI